MKLFFAGNAGHGKIGVFREDLLINEGAGRLMSYFWLKEQFYKNFKRWADAKEANFSGLRNDGA